MVLHEHGKRLPTLQEYAALLMPAGWPDDSETLHHSGTVSSGLKNEFCLVQTSEKGYRMMPGPEFCPRLYRGQTEHHSPCRPGLYRGLSPAGMLYWTAKTVEFGMLVMLHPAARDMITWDFDGLQYEFDFEAIAQHYGYPTRILDLTRSRDVAMFFATHHIQEGSRPEPALGCRAVLYTIDLKRFIESRANTGGDFAPIGLCPLPRPTAQNALGVKLRQSEDFDLLPGIKKETMTVTPELARRCAGPFDNGRLLFPGDRFESHIKTLRENGRISSGAIRAAVDSARIPPHPGGLKGIEKCLTDRGYRVHPEGPRLPSAETLAAASRQWLRRRAGYIARVRWRGMADAL